MHKTGSRRKFRNVFRITLMMAGTTLTAGAYGGQPVGYDGWSVANGVIDTSVSCAQAISCTTMVEDKGFLQQEVITPAGRFIRQIVTDPDASGNAASLGFASEAMIPFDQKAREASPSGWNIDVKQAIRDPSQGFESLAQIERHPYQDAQNNVYDVQKVLLSQSISDATFAADFRLDQQLATLPDGSEQLARSLDIDQTLLNETNPLEEQQRFALRERGGAVLSFDGNNVAQLTPLITAGELSLDGQAALAWNDGDTLKAVWVGQKDFSGQDAGFAYQSVSRLDGDGKVSASVSRSSITETGVIDPFAWDTHNLGPAPQLPAAVQ